MEFKSLNNTNAWQFSLFAFLPQLPVSTAFSIFPQHFNHIPTLFILTPTTMDKDFCKCFCALLTQWFSYDALCVTHSRRRGGLFVWDKNFLRDLWWHMPMVWSACFRGHVTDGMPTNYWPHKISYIACYVCGAIFLATTKQPCSSFKKTFSCLCWSLADSEASINKQWLHSLGHALMSC